MADVGNFFNFVYELLDITQCFLNYMHLKIAQTTRNQPFPAAFTNISEFCCAALLTVMNAIHITFCCLHVFNQIKLVCSFHNI